MADALNRTGLAVDRRLKVALAQKLDRPTPFTLNAIGRYRARSTRLKTLIFVKDIQAKYLMTAAKGGRLPTVLTPIGINLDRHGNIRGKRGGLERIAAMGKGRFIAEINGAFGVWQRHGPGGRKLKLLVRVDKNSPRAPRWDFHGIAERVAKERLLRDVRDALAAEIRRQT